MRHHEEARVVRVNHELRKALSRAVAFRTRRLQQPGTQPLALLEPRAVHSCSGQRTSCASVTPPGVPEDAQRARQTAGAPTPVEARVLRAQPPRC
ncbi:hypothetical protein T492DRAFT_1035549 [Pavlovales sp. CCMP2436]|nr:hypothetical protein T492DRAFT_1035549 [Pavlovales sp. CCMP2436]